MYQSLYLKPRAIDIRPLSRLWLCPLFHRLFVAATVIAAEPKSMACISWPAAAADADADATAAAHVVGPICAADGAPVAVAAAAPAAADDGAAGAAQLVGVETEEETEETQ